MTSIAENLKTARFFHQKGKLQQAEMQFQKVLKIKPNQAEALHALGLIAYQLNNFKVSIDFITKAIKNKPHIPQFYYNYGLVFIAQNRLAEAVRALEKAIEIKSDYADAYFNLALIFKEQSLLDKSIEYFKQAVHLNPDNADAYYNLGNIYKILDRNEAAAENYRQAVEKNPNFAMAYNNLGLVLKEQGLISEAVSHYREAIRLNTDFAEAHWNLSLALLLSEDFQEGWKEHEWRFRRETKRAMTYPYDFGIPHWDGSPFDGKRLFVHSEQGLGDTLQFIRYLPLVKRLGGTVIFETFRPLLGLLNGFPGIDELVEISPNRNHAEKCDYYVPLMSLPLLFNTEAQTIPADVPYIRADSVKIESWRNLLPKNGFKVGIVWAGKIRDNDNRPCSLKHFLSICGIPGVQLIGLQKGESVSQLQELPEGMTIINLGEKFKDFSDTAGAIENLDLVVSIDTSVAHLAGAMGKHTWVLLPFAPDWRWRLSGKYSRWYPTMRLFRQPSSGDWSTVFSQVAEELRAACSQERTSGSTRQFDDIIPRRWDNETT